MIQDNGQQAFNQIKGKLHEIGTDSKFPSITLEVGNKRQRLVNIVLKPDLFELVKSTYKIGDKIGVKFFVSSRYKHGRYYTMANALEVFPYPSSLTGGKPDPSRC